MYKLFYLIFRRNPQIQGKEEQCIFGVILPEVKIFLSEFNILLHACMHSDSDCNSRIILIELTDPELMFIMMFIAGFLIHFSAWGGD